MYETFELIAQGGSVWIELLFKHFVMPIVLGIVFFIIGLHRILTTASSKDSEKRRDVFGGAVCFVISIGMFAYVAYLFLGGSPFFV